MRYNFEYGFDSYAFPTWCWVMCGIVSVIGIVFIWRIFEKAGVQGWASLIPFYNLFKLFEITLGNGWKFLLTLIPIVNIVFGIMVMFKLAKVFGKGTGFGFGLLFLPLIFEGILAFDSSEYQGIQEKS